MSDLIKREDAIEVISNRICDNKWVCEYEINSLPSADAVSREDIIGYIDRVRNSGLGRNKALEYIRKYVERTESAEPSKVDFRTDKPVNIGTEVNDLISRADAIEAVMKHHDGGLNQINYGLTLAKNEIQALPSADRPSGEWQRVDEQPYFRKHYHKVCCSVCHKQGSEKYNYCPNCGAKMKGGTE